MLQPIDLQSFTDWLIYASYFNKLWHQCDNFIRQDSFIHLSKGDQEFYDAKRLTLRNQKQTCQLTALRLFYDNHLLDYQSNLILTVDTNETGINDDGIFYSLYSQSSPEHKCHIPYPILIKNLTKKEQKFFNLLPHN